MHFFSPLPLCNRLPHISVRLLQTMAQNPSLCTLTACPVVELGSALSSLTFSRLFHVGSQHRSKECSARQSGYRGYRHYRHHARSSKVHGAAHFAVIDLPLMCWSITLLRAMRSPCRAPWNSNGKLPAQETMDVSSEHKHTIFTRKRNQT